tara:strand:- start:5315 stop:6514 length:1200 start_codon:yes stop_codon:yes gene_type:complete
MLKAKPIRFYEVTNTPILFAPNASIVVPFADEDTEIQAKAINHYQEFSKGLLKTVTKWEFPTHFDISEYYLSKSSIVDTDKIIHNPISIRANKTKTRFQNYLIYGKEELEKAKGETLKEKGDNKVGEFIKDWSLEFTEILKEQNFVWAIPSYENSFYYFGHPNDGQENSKGVYVERVKRDDGYVLNIFPFEKQMIDKKNYVTHYGLSSEVFLDEFGRVTLYRPQQLTLMSYVGLDSDVSNLINEKLNKGKELQASICAGLNAELFERFYEVYHLIELFALMNIKSEYEILEYSDSKPTKKSRKQAQSRFKVREEEMVFKTLKINSKLGIKNDDGKYERLTFGGLKEHTRRGHTKTYTPERPRFGKAHKNNIGTFFYPETLVGESRLGIVHKDYKFEEEE